MNVPQELLSWRGCLSPAIIPSGDKNPRLCGFHQQLLAQEQGSPELLVFMHPHQACFISDKEQRGHAQIVQ